MRNAIKHVAPKAEEIISYNIPGFKQHRGLVSYGGFKNHIGFFPGAAAILKFKDELHKIQNIERDDSISIRKSLPTALIKKIVRHRVTQEAEKLKSKTILSE